MPETRTIVQDGIFIVEADDSMMFNHAPLDLVGQTLLMTPQENAYAVSRAAAQLRPRGGLAVDFGSSSSSSHSIDLPFSFPFYGQSYDRIHVTNRNGIFFSPPSIPDLNQYEMFDLASIREAVIAPLLLASFPRTFVAPAVHVSSSADQVVITWVADSIDFGYEVQAVLGADGTIEMTWGSTRDVEWGGVVVTPGLDQFQMPRHTVLDMADAAGDASGSRGDLDLTAVTIERFGETDLLEVRIDLQGAVRPDLIGQDGFVQYGIDTGNMLVAVHLTRTERYLLLPDRGWIQDPGSLELDGSTVRFLIQDVHLAPGLSVMMNAWVWNGDTGSTADTASAPFASSRSSKQFALDLSAIDATVLDRPLVESFTLTDMNPHAVLDRLVADYGLDPVEVEALAIYQDFFTDLVLYAGAYSTVGNSGADGVSTRSSYGSQQPRYPALLHMSKLGYRYNSAEESSIHVLNHELGHRWLYFFEILENGQRTMSLNPLGGHPAQYVHTPAAFDVRGPRNSSAMGGSWFEDLGNGQFKARETLASFGYSWHELYLMGLADAEEVEPWFYIANTQPKLGDAYYPPDGITVTGQRRNVTVDQMIGAMGPRLPGPKSSRKRFEVYFVLLTRDLDQLRAQDVAELEEKRALLQQAIPLATGGRASVATIFGEEHPRRRVSRRP